MHQESFALNRPPAVVSNGFDPEDLSTIAPLKFEDHAIVYAGTFYEYKREIGPVLEGIVAANALHGESSRPICLHYFGPDEKHVKHHARRLGADRWVRLHGRVPRKEALSAIKGATASVIITSIHDEESDGDRGILTGKIFETIGLGSRALLVAPAGSEARALVERCGAGRCFKGTEVREMAAWLQEVSRSEAPAYQPPNEWAWPLIARGLSAYLEQSIRRTPR